MNKTTIKNSVICISAEGSAHIFDFPLPLNELAANTAPTLTPAAAVIAEEEEANSNSRRGSLDPSTVYNTFLSRISAIRDRDKDRDKSLPSPGTRSAWDRPALTLKVPVNVNRILIADIGQPFFFFS